MISLMYHCVYVDNPSDSGFQNASAVQYKVCFHEFERHVTAINSYCEENNISHDEIEFTFDDGGTSFYFIIAPILEKFNFKGAFFISTEYIGTKGFLTEEYIRDLYCRGHIIASHSHSHSSNLSALSKAEIFVEWKKSREILERITNSVVTMASIPNGYDSRKVIMQAFLAGYEKLYTSVPTTKICYLNNMQIIGRYVIYDSMTLEDVMLIISNSCIRQKLWVYWFILKFVKSVFGHNYNIFKSVVLKFGK